MGDMKYYRLLHSVGENGDNLPYDVKAVKLGLQNHGFLPVVVNDRHAFCDIQTIYAIKRFQSRFMHEPDGLVKPDSETWCYLAGRPGFSKLPFMAYDTSKVVLRAGERKFRWPLKENRIRRGIVNHTFGMVRTKIVNGQPQPKAHQGWDLYAPVGTECYAIANGKIVRVDTAANNGNQASFGKLIVIELDSVKIGGQKVYATYAHLSEINVTINDEVKLGKLLGKTGNTGNASNMTGQDQHLHFELREEISPGTGLQLQKRYDPKLLYGDPPYTAILDH
jgi:hypothetical protein